MTAFYAKLKAEVVNDESSPADPKVIEPPRQGDQRPNKSAGLESDGSAAIVADSTCHKEIAVASAQGKAKATPRKKIARRAVRPTPKRPSRPKFLRAHSSDCETGTSQSAVPAAPQKFSFSRNLSMGRNPPSLLRQAAMRVLHLNAGIWNSSSLQAPLMSQPEQPPRRLNKHAYREEQERRTKKKNDCLMPPKKRVCHDPVGRVRTSCSACT